MYRTPLLVPTNTSFEEYVRRLSKPAKKNYKKAEKDNAEKSHELLIYDGDLIAEFMALWEQQEVFGRNPRWIFGPEYFHRKHEQGCLACFAAVNGNVIYAMHPVEIYGDYAYSQPVMYDKEFNEVSTWMWFNTIRALCGSHVNHFDLGGAFHGTWVDLLKDRKDPILSYKWRYVPKDIKEDPDAQEPYERFDCNRCGAKQIVIGRTGCKFCGV